jgi:hypothetical protein
MSRPKKEMVSSMGAAAAALGSDVGTLRAARAAGAPGFKSNGSVDLAPLRAWLKDQPAIPEGEETEASLKIRKLRLQCETLEETLEKLKDERALFRRKYTDNAVVRADAIRAATAVCAALNTFIADAPTWAGLTETEIERKAVEGGEKVKAALHNPKSAIYGE